MRVNIIYRFRFSGRWRLDEYFLCKVKSTSLSTASDSAVTNCKRTLKAISITQCKTFGLHLTWIDLTDFKKPALLWKTWGYEIYHCDHEFQILRCRGNHKMNRIVDLFYVSHAVDVRILLTGILECGYLEIGGSSMLQPLGTKACSFTISQSCALTTEQPT